MGKGAAFVVGAFLGGTYRRGDNPGLETLIRWVCDDAGVQPSFEVAGPDGAEPFHWRYGKAGKANLLWITNAGAPQTVTITDLAGGFSRASAAKDLAGGKTVKLAKTPGGKQCRLTIGDGEYAVLTW